MTHHDGEIVDFSVVGVQSLVSFGVVLVDAGLGGEEGLLPGFNVGELPAIAGLRVYRTTDTITFEIQVM